MKSKSGYKEYNESFYEGEEGKEEDKIREKHKKEKSL